MKKLVSLLLVMCMSISLVACGGGDKKDNAAANTGTNAATNAATTNEKETEETASGENKLEQIKATGKLVIGLNADFPPFEFHKMIDGQDTITGFDILLGQEIAKDLGVELEIQDIEFASVLANVETGLIDLGLSGITATEERKQAMDFSETYFTPANTILVAKENLGKFTTPESLVDLNVGVQTATIQEDIATELGVKNVMSVAKIPDLVIQLNSGTLDAIILEEIIAQSYAYQNENLAVEKDIKFDVVETGSAVATKKGETELIAEVNKTIKRLKDEGKLDTMLQEMIELAAENN